MPRIPEGAKTTDLAPVANAARQQGVLSRIAGAVRYAIAGVSPDTWMSPNQPVTPVAQGAAGRRLDYPVGVNLTYTPRSTELTSFGQLRALADRCDLVRLAIETRKDQMASLVWTIGHVDDSKDVAADARVKALIDLFKRPDGVYGWQAWLRMLIEEVLVTDATAIYPRKRNNGEPMGFDLIDGTTIKPLVDDSGRRPSAPSPAFQQVLKGIPAVDYTADELLYAPRNPRVHKFYGFSPVEQVLLTINIALRRAAGQLQYFTEGNIPAAFASVPQEWTPEQIQQFQTYWDTVIEGDQAYKRKVRFVPGGTKVEAVKDAPLKDEFDEWIARVICYCFSLPPTAFVKQQNRSTSETQQEAALKEGLAPLMVWVKETLDYLIQHHLGMADLQFKWVEEESLDPTAQATILTTYQKQGVYSVNEIRAKLGEDPLPDEGANAYLIFTATGAAPLERALEPPPAPVAPGSAPPDPDQPPPKGGKPAPKDKAEKHAHGHLTKAAEPLTNRETALRDAFAAALDVVREAAVKQLNTLGKAAPVDDGSRNYTPEEITLFTDRYVTALDLSGLSLAWDDYSDTLQAVAADGSKHEVARLIVTEPDIEGTPAAIDILNHQDPRAIQWAADHAAKMLGKDGAGGQLADTTREMVRQAIANALDAHATNDELADMLGETYAFSPERAELIARTEVANALEQGSYLGAAGVGMKAKKWLLSNDEGICAPCSANAAQQWIPIDQPFQSGDAAPIAHPRCRCSAAYRRKLPEE